jgi:hypothetical protein
VFNTFSFDVLKKEETMKIVATKGEIEEMKKKGGPTFTGRLVCNQVRRLGRLSKSGVNILRQQYAGATQVRMQGPQGWRNQRTPMKPEPPPLLRVGLQFYDHARKQGEATCPHCYHFVYDVGPGIQRCDSRRCEREFLAVAPEMQPQ